MKTSTILLALVVRTMVGGLWMTSASPVQAADVAVTRQSTRSAVTVIPPGDTLPFPRSKQAQSVWASDACWSGCQSSCTWDAAACFRIDEQGNCLLRTDYCDRTCQRGCRTRGGPLVPDIFDF
jgi:hypothetical protein